MYYNESINLCFFLSGVTNISPSSISRSIFLLCKIEIVSYGSVNEEYSWMFDALADQTYFVLPPFTGFHTFQPFATLKLLCVDGFIE